MLLAPLLLTTGASIGATLRVPQDYSTIQAAIESASPGDEVVISPGTYEGGVFVDKDLTLRGESEITLAGSSRARTKSTLRPYTACWRSTPVYLSPSAFASW